MQLQFVINNKTYTIDSKKSINIAITQEFNNNQPNFFNTEKAKVMPLVTDSFVGSTEQSESNSCNVKIINLNIHCNGTHTECKQHIDHSARHISEININSFLYSKLISINPVNYNIYNKESYVPSLNRDDKIITSEILQTYLTDDDCQNVEALIIRTLPNTRDKTTFQYNSDDNHLNNFPFVTNSFINLLNTTNIKHLLIDTPSLERNYNSLEMSNHNLYWQNDDSKTITEFVYIDNQVSDDYYILNLQLPDFALDAAPSRPLLFKLENNYDSI